MSNVICRWACIRTALRLVHLETEHPRTQTNLIAFPSGDAILQLGGRGEREQTRSDQGLSLDSTASVRIVRDDGKIAVHLDAIEEISSSIGLHDKREKTRLSFMNSFTRSPYVTLYDRGGVLRSAIAVALRPDGEPAMTFTDSTGRLRLMLKLEATGNAAIEILESNEKGVRRVR